VGMGWRFVRVLAHRLISYTYLSLGSYPYILYRVLSSTLALISQELEEHSKITDPSESSYIPLVLFVPALTIYVSQT